jgi:methionyl-tRNA formyltransferase
MDTALLVSGLKGALTLELLPKAAWPTSIYFYKNFGEHPSAHERLVEVICGRGIEVDPRREALRGRHDIVLAVGWQYLIPGASNLIVLHDSLLPRFRGFAPTVTALIRGETSIGVTAIRAVREIDSGPIICQRRLDIVPPISIEQAFKSLASCYTACLEEVYRLGLDALTTGEPQDESEASYSIWRDELDFSVDWELSANEIQRHILAVGYPYQGARTICNGTEFKILSAEVIDDIRFENRQPGKVWRFLESNCADVVCGSGMLRIVLSDPQDPTRPTVKKLRTRFG